jgi:hypothetical protein
VPFSFHINQPSWIEHFGLDNCYFFRDIRRYFEEIKQEQWQKLDGKEVLSACDKHYDNLHSLPKVARLWDVYIFTDDEIKRTKVS